MRCYEHYKSSSLGQQIFTLKYAGKVTWIYVSAVEWAKARKYNQLR